MGTVDEDGGDITHQAFVSCPKCGAEALQWRSAERYGIDCTSCGHAETFHRRDRTRK